ncbi:MAG: hypothetical protein AB1Z98_13085 [Nannocystaceae bacterium]
MQTSTTMLVELRARGVQFSRDSDLRLLHVIVPPWMREAALGLIADLAQRPEARGPWLVVDAESPPDCDPWRLRAQQLRDGYGTWQPRALDLQGPGWAPLPAEPAGSGLVVFVEQLGQVVLAAPPTGSTEIVVVLVPGPGPVTPSWDQLIRLLVGSGPLRSVRWVLVDVGVRSLSTDFAEEDYVLTVEPTVDATGATAASGGPGRGPSETGARAAGIVPPLRPRRGMAPMTIERDRVTEHAQSASNAMGDGDHGDAIEHQCRARDQANAEGDAKRTVAMELLLGGHLIAAGAPTQACSSYARAVTIAKDAGDLESSAIASLGLGSCRLATDDRPAAMVAFADAAACADEAGSTMLTIEACRLTGELALALGMEGHAVTFWSRAIRCGRADPLTASSGSVLRCAVALERLCKRRGLEVEAARVLDSAGAEAPRSDVVEPDPADAGEPAPGTEVLRGWTVAEREILVRSTRQVVEADATSLLTPAEIAALHGWEPLPPPRDHGTDTVVLMSSSGNISVEDTLAGETVWLDPKELERVRQGLGEP